MSSTRPDYLRAEMVKPREIGSSAPTLDRSDEDAERSSVAQVGDRKTRTLIGLALGACVIAGLALASSTVGGGLHVTFASAPTSLRNTQREESRELVNNLFKQVEAPKGEIQQLLGAAGAAAGAGHYGDRG